MAKCDDLSFGKALDDFKKIADAYKNNAYPSDDNIPLENQEKDEDINRADNLDRKLANKEELLKKLTDLAESSEEKYMELATEVVDKSIEQLNDQNESKNKLKRQFSVFFIIFVSLQFIALIVLIVLRGSFEYFNLSDGVLITFVTSVIVETLSAIAIMIKYAFDSDQEVKILTILNSVISNFKKFNEKK